MGTSCLLVLVISCACGWVGYQIGAHLHPAARRDDGPYVSSAFGFIGFMASNILLTGVASPETVPLLWWAAVLLGAVLAGYLAWFGPYLIRGGRHGRTRRH